MHAATRGEKGVYGSVTQSTRLRDKRVDETSVPSPRDREPPPLLRRGDIARLLNVSNERARQITNGADFPQPVVTEPHRAWNREEVQWWMDDVNWWGRYRWRKPREA